MQVYQQAETACNAPSTRNICKELYHHKDSVTAIPTGCANVDPMSLKCISEI